MNRSTAVLVALMIPLLAACGSDDATPGGSSSASPTSAAEFAEKNLDTAVAAVQEYTDRYTSGDYEGAYDLAVQKTKDAYSVEEFEQIQEGCYKGDGMPLDVEGVRINGDEATVRLVVMGFKDTRKAYYEDGGWKMGISKDNDLSMTVEEQVAKCEAESTE